MSDSLETCISRLEKQILEYEGKRIPLKSDEEFVLLDKQLTYCLEQVAEYDRILHKPDLVCNTPSHFHELCDMMNEIMKTDMTVVDLQGRLKIYLKLYNMIKACSSYTRQNEIKIIEL